MEKHGRIEEGVEDTNKEKRRHRRFSPKVLAFAALRPDFFRLGRIRNISKSGVAFEYLDYGEDEENSRPKDSSQIDIFVSRETFHIMRISCRLVYDVRVDYTGSFSASLFENRCCGLEFTDLTDEQERKLDFFLKNHVTDVQRLM